ncbi:lytic transglycosylase domain-containing protein [Acinetobacter sedimenti]|uniref:lytic transglycosylase domain-containing protein n=1 Tax=Acinetobacter sedimenti TaxID=2919922 RepID=UPI002AC8726D|nr:transglycosylase SLT domain-containing protein [Acinetobacter sedimenti]
MMFSPIFKVFCIVSLITIFATGCSTLRGNAQQKSQKLAQGIQRAYAINPSTAQRISPYIIEGSEKYDIDPILIAAVIKQESNYRGNARSPSGAVGLMQVIPSYWRSICGSNLYDERTNVLCGSHILADYHDKAGSWKKATAYYNVGPAGYERSFWTRWKVRKYVKSVKSFEKKLKDEL